MIDACRGRRRRNIIDCRVGDGVGREWSPTGTSDVDRFEM